MENSHIFRSGMALRKGLYKELFPNLPYEVLVYEGKIYENGGFLMGTKEFKDSIDEEIKPAISTKFSKLYLAYPNVQSLDIIYNRKTLDELGVNVPLAIVSGYLKVDSRGYYFTRNIEKRGDYIKNVIQND